MALVDLPGQPRLAGSPSAAVAKALDVVGVDGSELSALLAAYDGQAYLVGSLAVGLGDLRSDVDIHVVSDDPMPSEGSVLLFTRAGVCVDVHYLGHLTVERRLATESRLPRARLSGRSGAWLMSRWLNALPLQEEGPALLSAGQRARAIELITKSLTENLIALTAFAVIAERSGSDRSWYLCRRAGVAAWELAASMAGQHYLGERWLPSRSADPRVASVAEVACSATTTAELAGLLRQLGLAVDETLARVRLFVSPDAERWTIADQEFTLVGGRRLVHRVRPVPADAAGAAEGDAKAVLAGLARGALSWTVDLEGIAPRLEDRK